MKKNKRLLYTLGNIPEKYIDEAMSEQARKMKIQWKYIVTAAACFVVITAFPVYMLRKSLNQQNNGMGAYTDVSQITSTVNSNTDTTTPAQTELAPDSEPGVTTQCKFPGTGPKKPADYKPDKMYSIIDGSGYDVQDGYFVVTFLKNKDFQERINSDLREAADSLKPYFDEKYMGDGTHADDANPWEIREDTNGVYYEISCSNGYLSLSLSYITIIQPDADDEGIQYTERNYHHLITLNYDLIEEKKIENFSDLFYKGEDILSLISSHGVDESCNNHNCIYTEVPQLFTIDSIFINPDNTDKNNYSKIIYRTENDSIILDHMITGKYRDIRGIVDDNFIDQISDLEDTEEWTYELKEDFQEQDNLTICYEEITGSRYHTKEDCEKYSQLYKKLQYIGVEYYKKNYGIEDSPDLFYKTDNGYKIYAFNFSIYKVPYLKNIYGLGVPRYPCININSETLETVPLTDIINNSDTSMITDLYEWRIVDIENNTIHISAEVSDDNMGKKRVLKEFDLQNINKKYFNPDYEQLLSQQTYY